VHAANRAGVADDRTRAFSTRGPRLWPDRDRRRRRRRCWHRPAFSVICSSSMWRSSTVDFPHLRNGHGRD